MKSLVMTMAWTEVKRFVLWVSGALVLAAVLKTFIRIDLVLFVLLPTTVAYGVALASMRESIAGNAGWLFTAPVSRRSLWLANYGLNAMRLTLIVWAYLAGMTLAMQFQFEPSAPRTQVERNTPSSTDAAGVGFLGTSKKPYLVTLALMVHLLLSVVISTRPYQPNLRAWRPDRKIAMGAIFLGLVVLTPRTWFFLSLNFVLSIGLLIYLVNQAVVTGVAMPRAGQKPIFAFNYGLAVLALIYGLT